MVGLIIDDYFYQKNETEHQVKALQKAEKTIDKLNNELVEYADKAEKLEKKLWNPDWCQIIDKLDEIIDEEAPFPSQLRKVFMNAEDEIWYKLDYLARALCMRNVLNDVKNKHMRELENKVNELDVTNRKLKSALEFCQKEASSAREHAHNVEVNAERIRKGLD